MLLVDKFDVSVVQGEIAWRQAYDLVVEGLEQGIP